MMFNLASLIPAVVLALPLAAIAAPAFPSGAVVTTHVPQTSGRPRPSGVAMLEDRARSKTFKVTVGKVNKGGKPRFSPQHVKAKAGDTIEFEFYPAEHSVTETSFENPCFEINGGFDTGPISVSEGKTSTRTITVTDKQPKWFYSSAGYDCTEGMVFAVNPPKSGNTFKKFQFWAIHAVE